MSLTVSVITAVHNRAATIGQMLASVQAQTGVRVEHIAIDGGSSDGTLEILRAQRQGIAVLISEPDGGIYEALNKGLACASGAVVGFLHSDDFFAHERVLERVASAFADPAVQAVYGDLDYMAQDGVRVIRHWRSGEYARHKLAQGWMPPHPTLYLRRDVYQRLGGFDTGFRIAADYEFMLRVLAKGGIRPAYIPEVLVKMRWGGESNRSLPGILRKSREDYAALRRHEVGGLWTLCRKNFGKLGQFF